MERAYAVCFDTGEADEGQQELKRPHNRPGFIDRVRLMLAELEEPTPAEKLLARAGIKFNRSHRSLAFL